MSHLQKEFISDKTLLTWIMLCTFSSIGCMLITAVVVYIIYDCWIMYRHQLAGGTCNLDVNTPLVFFIPIVLGLIIGTVLTRKITKEDTA